MRLENSFEVPAPPEQAWDLLMDVPRVIPCMPGAELTEQVDDSSWKAKVTVKLGPMSFAFASDVKREEADVDARRAKLSARARELRGRGGGQATIESTLAPVDGGTRVHIVTDLALSGAVAQYGGGMLADVAAQLVNGFADCLKTQLAPVATQAAPAPPPRARPVAGLPLILGALRGYLARRAGFLRHRRRSDGDGAEAGEAMGRSRDPSERQRRRRRGLYFGAASVALGGAIVRFVKRRTS
jgi:carbon monoxide dehydrogenase subunit G